jgi:outer membrane protein OmpA-like peptidoglycan-associated protein
LVVLASALALGSLHLFAQDNSANQNLSREMQLAIRYYEKGDDTEAMDRFMTILTSGDPAERNLANEYINLITRRMNTGERTPTAPASRRPDAAVAESPAAPTTAAAAASAPRAPEILVEPAPRGDPAAAVSPAPRRMAAPAPAPAPVQAPVPERQIIAETPAPQADKSLMRKEIKSKIRSAVESGLRDLRASDGVKVLMMENGDPQAVALPSSLLFQQGIGFQKEAGPVLDALTRMIFGLGSAQAIILPEGTAVGDAKILDMRRTMGVSSQLLSAGIAPSRVKVNLLNTQVEIPTPLMDFKGVVVLFIYNQPMNLTVEGSLGEEGGPPLSLGIYPPSFRPDKGEGAIIEFSVEDPPAGLVSWKFQLLQPAEGEARDLAPLQDIAGGSPVFHQIYWNGRQNYFGPPLAAGRYECVLTATDAKNRQRTLHRWIQLIDSSAPPGAPMAAAKPAASAPAGAPPTELAPGSKADTLVKDQPEINAVEIGKTGAVESAPAPKKHRKRAAPPAEKSASADAAPVKPMKPDTGNFELAFNANTHQLTREAERQLEQVAQTMVYYPMENLKIVGYAESAETDSAGLAERRAQMVASLLINKYQIEPKKIQVTSTVVETPTHKVEIDFVKNE